MSRLAKKAVEIIAAELSTESDTIAATHVVSRLLDVSHERLTAAVNAARASRQAKAALEALEKT